MDYTYKTGDQVRLKGGAQHMVVQRPIGPLADMGLDMVEDGTPCYWIDKNGRPQSEVYAAAMLEPVGNPEAL